jgi:hypothetical protein
MTPARIPPAHDDALPAPGIARVPIAMPGVGRVPFGAPNAAMSHATCGVARVSLGASDAARVLVAWSACRADAPRCIRLRGGEAVAR